MALKYTKKEENYEKDERTINVSEFVNRMVDFKRTPDKTRTIENTESPK